MQLIGSGGIVLDVNFAEKLRRLMAGKSRAQLARDADLPIGVINNYLNRGSAPMAVAAFRIARALNVPTDWLIDDTRDWPPENAKPDLTLIPDHALMHEGARRYREHALLSLAWFEKVEKIDWREKAIDLLKTPLGAELSDAQRETLSLFTTSRGNPWADYEPSRYAATLHDTMPGADRPCEDLDAEALQQRFEELLMRNPELIEIDEYQLKRDAFRRGIAPDAREAWRRQTLAEVLKRSAKATRRRS